MNINVEVYPGDDYPPFRTEVALVQYRDPATRTKEDPHPAGWLLYHPDRQTPGQWGPVVPLHATSQAGAVAEAEGHLENL